MITVSSETAAQILRTVVLTPTSVVTSSGYYNNYIMCVLRQTDDKYVGLGGIVS